MKQILPGWLWISIVLLLLGTGPGQAASEEILTFESRMTVHADATMTVTETIRVVATGDQIKRGLYRDLPTAYTDKNGNRIQAAFTVLGVRRNNQTSDFWTEANSGNLRIYMGNRDVFLKPGVHVFELTYKTENQIGYFPDFDEIYWNATGDKWAFPIRQAEAIVRLPIGAKVVQQAAYTGVHGSTAQAFTTSVEPDGSPRFTTTQTLKPGEGLTVAVAWPKGFVNEPSGAAKTASWFKANRHTILLLVGAVIVFTYYLFVWNRVGRDPEGGPIIPLFSPPGGYSPAAAHYVMNKGFGNAAFTAAIISLAVKGALRIEQDGKDFSLTRTNPWAPKDLSAGEKAVFRNLFRDQTSVFLSDDNHEIIGAARNALNRKIDNELQGTLFKNNKRYLTPGTVLSLAVVLGSLILSGSPENAIFMGLWLSLWTLGCSLLISRVVKVWRDVGSADGSLAVAMGLSFFSIPFLAGEILGIGQLAGIISLPATLLILLVILQLPVFMYLLHAPTVKGRRIMDQLEGFKLYLSVAEQQLLEFRHPPERTPELFESYLPYALALGVSHQWSRQFDGLLGAEAATAATPYHPDWYTGDGWDSNNISGFGEQFENAFSDALGSSATPPDSGSLGSGGGGFSGGGGGGGGGGGF